MKNTSILIPIVLIGCLAALGFLFYKAFQTAEDDALRTNDRIVLDPNDYADDPPPPSPGDRTDYDELPPPPPPANDAITPDSEASEGLRELTPEEREAARRDFAERQGTVTDPEPDPGYDYDAGSEFATDEPDPAPATTRSEPRGSGRYLVIAGSFRVRDNAVDRVRALQRADFTAARVEPFNRGTFAVALAGQSDSYQDAQDLARRIRTAGFEVEVMRRR